MPKFFPARIVPYVFSGVPVSTSSYDVLSYSATSLIAPNEIGINTANNSIVIESNGQVYEFISSGSTFSGSGSITGDYVLVTGDTMTGDLVMQGSNFYLDNNKGILFGDSGTSIGGHIRLIDNGLLQLSAQTQVEVYSDLNVTGDLKLNSTQIQWTNGGFQSSLEPTGLLTGRTWNLPDNDGLILAVPSSGQSVTDGYVSVVNGVPIFSETIASSTITGGSNYDIVVSSGGTQAFTDFVYLDIDNYNVRLAGDNPSADFGGTVTRSFITGEDDNTIINSSRSAVIGGQTNVVKFGFDSGIFVGLENYINNTIPFYGSGIFAGSGNTITDSSFSSIIAGSDHTINADCKASVLIGGLFNSINNSVRAGVFVGTNNNITGTFITTGSTIFGGRDNTINESSYASIIGSVGSTIETDSTASVIIGGTLNSIPTASQLSAIIGGQSNSVIGVNRSVVIGGLNLTATTDNTVVVPYLEVNDYVTLTPRASAPTGSAGRIYFNSSDNTMYCYDGTTWNALF